MQRVDRIHSGALKRYCNGDEVKVEHAVGSLFKYQYMLPTNYSSPCATNPVCSVRLMSLLYVLV